MLRFVLSIIVLSFLAADTIACDNAARSHRRHPVRNFIAAVVTLPVATEHTRIVHRERHVVRGGCAAVSGVVVVPAAPAVVPCPAGKCPMKK